MSGDANPPQGPDLRAGVPASKIPDGGPLLGHVDDTAVLLVRQGGAVFAIAATCTHWGGPLAEGLIVDGTIRCPWHHACFAVRTGALLGGPAQDPLARWQVEEQDGTVRVTGALEPESRGPRRLAADATVPDRVVIVGGGAAGTVAAAELRRCGYERSVMVIDPDPDASVDRPNLSKDYLAGKAEEAWIPLRSAQWWKEQHIERRNTGVVDIDPTGRTVTLAGGERLAFGALILATGAEPVRLPLPGEGPPVQTLRTLADARRIIEAAEEAKRVAVLGASFIGLEVAASLRARGLEVHVVAPEARPLERIMGPKVGDFVRALHEEHGVRFHLERTAAGRTGSGLTLSDGTTVAADLVIVGAGVRPRVELAQRAGLTVDNGVVVNQRLETSAPGIFAAGDIARYPLPRGGDTARIEHWVVAHRQGRTAARNALGMAEPYTDAPFFWSQHYDVPIAYVGYAPAWDAYEVDGSFAERDVTVKYRRDGQVRAMASVFRDVASLQLEAELGRR